MATNTLRLLITANSNQAAKELKKLSRDMKSWGDGMKSVGRSLTLGVTVPLIGVGAAATKLAVDAVESENLFNVSLGKMRGQARTWSEEMAHALGVNAYETRRYLGLLDVMVQSFGFNEKKALDLSQNLTKLAYDMSSFYNIPFEQAFEKLRSGIAGQIRPLRELGIDISKDTITAYAFANGIAKVEKNSAKAQMAAVKLEKAQDAYTQAVKKHGKESIQAREAQARIALAHQAFTKALGGQRTQLTTQQKVLARYGVIMHATTKAQGDMARTINSPANQLRVLTERLKDVGIQFGTLVLPYLIKFATFARGVVESLSKMDGATKKFVLIGALVAAAVGPALLVLGQLLSVVGSLAGVMSSVAAAGGFAAFAAGFAPALPILGAVVGVVAAIAAGAYLVVRNWGRIKPVVMGVVQAVTGPQGFGYMRQWFAQNMPLIHRTVAIATAGITALWRRIGPAIVPQVRAAFQMVGIVLGYAMRLILNTAKLAMQVFTGNWRGAWVTVKAIGLDTLHSFGRLAVASLRGLGGSLEGIARSVFGDKLVDGAKRGISRALSAIKGLIGRIIAAVKGVLGLGKGDGIGVIGKETGDGIGELVGAKLKDLMSFGLSLKGGGSAKGLTGHVRQMAQLAAQFGLGVSSGFRPGAITASGNRSLHASGRAIDVVGSAAEKWAAFKYFTAHGRELGLYEAINQHSIWKPGRGVYRWPRNDHMDHLHLGFAFAKGGIVNRPTLAYVAETAAARRGGGEAIAPIEKLVGIIREAVGGGGITQHINAVGVSPDQVRMAAKQGLMQALPHGSYL